jgi:hypothetical protein
MTSGALTRQVAVPPLRPIAWMLLVAVAVEAVLVSLMVLWPPDGARSVVSGQVLAWAGQATSASLVYRDGRWRGSTNDFPPGSTVHFRPQEHPGFYLVRYSEGSFRALADRSPHRGQRLEWRDMRFRWAPGLSETTWGFNDGDSTFFTDGFPASGPTPRPLDLFPVAVEAGQVRVAPYAQCPPRPHARPHLQPWCNPSSQPDARMEWCGDVYPETC